MFNYTAVLLHIDDTQTSECRSCKISPNRSSLDKSTSFCKRHTDTWSQCKSSVHASIMSSIWTPAETCLSRSFDITVHEEALNGVGLGYSRFLHILLDRSFRTSFSCKATYFTLFTQGSLHSEYNTIKMLCDAIQEERLPLLSSTTSSSKSSSKISLPSSKYPVPSE